MECELNYDHMVLLDAEDLAEAGLAEAYGRLLVLLREYVPEPDVLEEAVDDDAPSYVVAHRGVEYVIFGPGLEDDAGKSWGRATHAFFAIVNAQLAGSDHQFYAINGGNDLGGLFLTTAEADAAKRSLPRKSDWPYIPTQEHPWYGQHHD